MHPEWSHRLLPNVVSMLSRPLMFGPSAPARMHYRALPVLHLLMAGLFAWYCPSSAGAPKSHRDILTAALTLSSWRQRCASGRKYCHPGRRGNDGDCTEHMRISAMGPKVPAPQLPTCQPTVGKPLVPAAITMFLLAAFAWERHRCPRKGWFSGPLQASPPSLAAAHRSRRRHASAQPCSSILTGLPATSLWWQDEGRALAAGATTRKPNLPRRLRYVSTKLFVFTLLLTLLWARLFIARPCPKARHAHGEMMPPPMPQPEPANSPSSTCARPAPLAGGTGAVYFTVLNGLDQAVQLVSASSPGSRSRRRTKPRTKMASCRRRRRRPTVIPLQPARALLLQPSGGKHIMLIGLVEPLEPGDEVERQP